MIRGPIVFPDVEGLVASHLTTQLAAYGRAAPASVSVPNPRPAEFVTVVPVGGARPTLVTDAALLAVEAWAQTDSSAASLARLSLALIEALPGQVLDGTPFYRVEVGGGPQLFPDPASQQSRYTFTVSVHVRGAAI